MKIPFHVKTGRVNTVWIRLVIFWELSHDENYLLVHVLRCCQFSCQATSAVTPVSLELMIINDTLSLHSGRLQGGATAIALPHSLCLGHCERDACVLSWRCWGSAYRFRITPACSKQGLSFCFHVTSLPWIFVLYLWVLSSLWKGACFALSMIVFLILSIKNNSSNNKSRLPCVLTHSINLGMDSGYEMDIDSRFRMVSSLASCVINKDSGNTNITDGSMVHTWVQV